MQNYVPFPMEARSGFVLVTPNCPTCKTGVRLVQVTPIIFSPDLDERPRMSVTNAAGRQRGRLSGFKRGSALPRRVINDGAQIVGLANPQQCMELAAAWR
jgi:hypothetical protein